MFTTHAFKNKTIIHQILIKSNETYIINLINLSHSMSLSVLYGFRRSISGE